MAMSPHYVIIGNGVAGNAAADAIRARDTDARITIISAERSLFYYRPRLPDFLARRLRAEMLTVRHSQHYRDVRIRLRLGQMVERVDPLRKELYLRHKERISYTRLLLAVGAKPRLPEALSHLRSCMSFLKTYDDALQLAERLPSCRNLLLLAGDLISLQMAGALLDLDLPLTLLLDEGCLWPLEPNPQVLREVRARLESEGARVLAGDAVARMERREGSVRVATEGGLEGEWDLVCGFFGLTPDVDFLLGSGLDVERGVIVDDYLQTNLPDVFAAGDCAQIYSGQLRDYWVSVGWRNAARQGQVAGANMVGERQTVAWEADDGARVDGLGVHTRWWVELGPDE